MAKAGAVVGDLLKSTGLGIMLGAAFGATYGLLYLVVAAALQGSLNEAGIAFIGGLYGGILGGIGGALTGFSAGVVAAICGRRFLALAWWLGGAAGGYLAARLMSMGGDNIWWYGLPTLIGSAVGAGLGWWLQRRDRTPKKNAAELSSG